MQRRRAAPGHVPASRDRSGVIDLEAEAAFGLGDRVFHQKFGYGAVTGVEGDKLSVAFEKAGEKKVVAAFVTAADEVPF